MKRIALAVALLSSVVGANLSPAFAEEEGMALSYAGRDADAKIAENVSAMQAWAEGEYQEHEGEGLFKKYPSEGKLMTEMATISKELQAKAEAAKQAGEPDKARAYYFSAEATAQYAARMPHMLEHRK
ncbi:MAG: hypothetical protein ABIR48_07790 [Gammaproteobacteria bacterium]